LLRLPPDLVNRIRPARRRYHLKKPPSEKPEGGFSFFSEKRR